MTVSIPLTKEYTAIVDDADKDLAALNWYTPTRREKDAYPRRTVKGKTVWMHREILQRTIGRLLIEGEICDHINGNIHDNRRCNLRVATRTQNLRNSAGQKRRIGKFKGVSLHKRTNRYEAYIRVDRKQIHLGYFDTAEEAHAAYCEAGRKYFGEFFNPGDKS